MAKEPAGTQLVLALTDGERSRYADLKATARQGYVALGSALTEIRDRRLYREEYATFEAFCRAEFQIGKTRAYQLIEHGRSLANLSTMVDVVQPNERQARELVELSPDDQQAVWQTVVETAPGGTVTAQHVRALVGVLKDVVAFDVIDPGTGEQVAWAALTPVQKNGYLKAAVAEETYERLQRQKAHVSRNMGDSEWFTPKDIIDRATRVLGAIDLDPFSSKAANAVVGATRYFDLKRDGLVEPWRGRVWMNPPYDKAVIGQCCERLVAMHAARDVTAAIALVNNATETEWFQALSAQASAVCFPKGRIRFWHPDKEDGHPLQGQALIYLGSDVAAFRAEFESLGSVWRR